MQKIRQSILTTLLISSALCSLPIAAEYSQKQPSPQQHTNILYQYKSEIADTALVLTAVWCAVYATGSYRLSRIPETSIPEWVKSILSYTAPFSLENQIRLELMSIGCAGGSLSALSLLLLKKLSWEKHHNAPAHQL